MKKIMLWACTILIILVIPGRQEFAGNRTVKLKNVIGVTHVDGKFHFTKKDFLNEGAKKIFKLGSWVINTWFDDMKRGEK
ncbi:MAG: hypothetical protein GY940_38400 [bacterium]|nr:hypothetical protein [bacterium]